MRPVPLLVPPLPAAALSADDDYVLLAKVDVEGFEEEVLDSLEPLIKRKRLLNILMELNKPQKLRRLGKDPNDLTQPVVVDWVIMMITRLVKLGYTIVPQWDGYKRQPRLGGTAADIRALAESGWNSVDLWAYMPVGHDGHDERVHGAEGSGGAAEAVPHTHGKKAGPKKGKKGGKKGGKKLRHAHAE